LKNKNKNLILLKDFVSESFLLERYKGLYDCPTGYGHNPFDKTCYPIPKSFDIAGISGLAPVLTKVIKGDKDTKKKKDTPDNPPWFPDKDGFAGLAIDWKNALDDPLGAMKSCAQVNPFTSFLAFAVNAPAGLTSYARLARGTFRFVKRNIGRGLWAGTTIAISTIGPVKAALGAMLFAAGLSNLTKDFDLDQNTDDLEANVKKLKKTVEDVADEAKLEPKSLIDSVTPSSYSVFCLTFIGASAFMSGRILRTLGRGVRGQGFLGNRARIAKDLADARFKKFMLTNSRSGLGSFFSKYGKSDDLSVLMMFKAKNKANIGFELGPNGFRFRGQGDVNFNVSDLNAAQKKWAKDYNTGNKITINVDRANEILAKQNDSIMAHIDASFRSQAGNEIKNIQDITGGHFQGNLQRIVKIIGRGGGFSRTNILRHYYKATTEAMEKVIDASKSDILELYRLQNGLNLIKSKLKDVPPSQMQKYRKMAAVDGQFGAAALVSDPYFVKMAKKEQPALVEYLNTYNQIHNKDLELSKKLALAHNILNEEAKFTQHTLGKKPSLDKFFSTDLGRQSSNTLSRKLDDLKLLFPTLEEAGLRSFTSIYGKFFFYPILTGGAVWAYGKIPELEGEVISSAVIGVTEEFVQKEIDEEYLKSIKPNRQTDELDLQKLFSDFETFYKNNISKRPSSKKSYDFVKGLAKVAPSDPNVDKYFNQGKYQNAVSEVQNNFLRFVSYHAKAYGKKPKKPLKEGKTIMKNKDIRNIVSEMLKENTGQGYAKYPYDSEQYNNDEPAADYVEEWKALGVELVRDESRNTAIELAKLLVKDLELFEDVLDLAGQNQSVGTEILRKLKEAREKS